jgi:site-specific DNA-cytosine methylase
MSKPTFATICTGGDLAGVGLMAAGYAPTWGVECDPAIAEVAEANVPGRILRQPAQDVRWAALDRPALLWASPPCPNFSQAKTGGEETPEDEAIAVAICDALRTLTPRAFCLENVIGYGRSRSLARIRAALDALGYWSVVERVNAADFGVPQTRRRLILRAVRGGLVPHLPRPVPWVGWYAAIADLIPTLPESAFAPWQLLRLDPLFSTTLVEGNSPTVREVLTRAAADPMWTVRAEINHGMPRAFLHMTGNTNLDNPTGTGLLLPDEPANTVVAGQGGKARAFLVDSKNANQEWARGFRADDEPGYTVVTDHKESHQPRAFIVDCQNNSGGVGLTVREADAPTFTVTASNQKRTARAWLAGGRVVAMTPRALARFQSVPDTYRLPEAKGLAARVIGNGVPPLLSQRIGEGLRAACED